MDTFKENIPSEVWAFVKKHTNSMITAGILALVIWNFLKKNKKKESISERINKLLEIKVLNIGTKVSFKDANGTKKIGKIKFYNRKQSGDYSVDVNGTTYHNIMQMLQNYI